MKAVKGNKEYSIDDTQKKHYQDAGYDILNDSGDTIAYGRGKTVPYDDYAALKKELDELRAASGTDNQDIIDILTAFAHEHSIDLGKCSTVNGIVKKIKEHKLEGGV